MSHVIPGCSRHGKPAVPAGLYVPTATPAQLQEIRDLGGHPRDDLTAGQAKQAINALKYRQGKYLRQQDDEEAA
jgi:hypothetical protein